MTFATRSENYEAMAVNKLGQFVSAEELRYWCGAPTSSCLLLLSGASLGPESLDFLCLESLLMHAGVITHCVVLRLCSPLADRGRAGGTSCVRRSFSRCSSAAVPSSPTAARRGSTTTPAGHVEHRIHLDAAGNTLVPAFVVARNPLVAARVEARMRWSLIS